jgi:hypothetical protein
MAAVMIDRVDGLLEMVVERVPLAADGKSGATLERVRLADGRWLVVKHVDPKDDWIARVTGDPGRAPRLWSSGVMARVPWVIDHATVSVELENRGWLVVMRDVSDALLADGRRLSRDEGRRVLAAAAELHAAFRGGPPVGGLTPVVQLYRLMSPQVASSLASEVEVGRLAVSGWERFPAVVPRDVAAAVAEVHDRPEALARYLAERPCTLVHGDLKLANLGFHHDRVVMLDWGSLTSWAPAAVDFAWFVAINAASVHASHDELLDDVRHAAGPDHDEEALRVALLGALAQLGWEKALGATGANATVRARERAGLAWWSARVREALEVWAPEGVA